MTLPRACAYGASAAALLLAVGLVTAWSGPARDVPSAQDVRAAHRPSDARLLDRDGAVLHEVRVDERRRVLEWTPLERISPALVAAVVHSEDRRFFSHHGIDVRALGAAAVGRIVGKPRRGASTITMQLAALLDPALAAPGGRTLLDKLRQIEAALALERRWSKAEILEGYLNLVPVRGDVVGVSAAASALLGKEPHGLSRAEALVLAALLRSPGASRERVLVRSAALARDMQMPIERAALEQASASALGAPTHRGPRPRLAPHLAHALFREREGQGDVQTTLAKPVQRRASEIVERELLGERARNVRDGAALVVENATGNVLAWVGGSGRMSSARHVDGVVARRQAGSTLKPFLYALALERRILTAASLLEDTPLELAVVGGIYRPRNYDEDFRGPVSVRTALASSLNVPAVRAQRLLGEPALVARLAALGFGGVIDSGDHYGPSLALGSAEVSLFELVNAYRTFANRGVWRPLRMTPEAQSSSSRRVFSEAASFIVSDILSDRESRSASFGLENPLATRFWTAVKTGTSKDMRDNWCVGFSREYTVGVWVGNFSGAPMHDVSGVTGAAPIWLEIMSMLHVDRASPPPEPPTGVVARQVAFATRSEPERVEWFVNGTEPLRARVEPATPRPSIVAPVDGTVLAIDPDVPEAFQRVALVSSVAGEELEWRLDGRALARAGSVFLWDPEPGLHELDLVDPKGLVRDRIRFAVRD